LLPFTLRGVARHAVVVDLVYAEGPTPLVESARASGLRVVDGREGLLAQVERQLTRMKRLAPPPGLIAGRLGPPPRITAGWQGAPVGSPDTRGSRAAAGRPIIVPRAAGSA